MPKPNTLLKRTTNALLDMLGDGGIKNLPSDSALARRFDVSRTTIRSALDQLTVSGLLAHDESGFRLVRPPIADDYFGEAETDGPQELIEREFMQRVLLGDWRPGHVFSEAELARDSNSSTVSVREFLIGFSRFGLIEKQPRCGWVLREFHAGFAGEVASMRELIETAAIRRMPRLSAPGFKADIATLIERHRAIERAMKTRHVEFPALDREFHLWIIGRLENRFARDFFDIVSFLFHYHYQWDKRCEIERSQKAIAEHLAVLEALQAGAMDRAHEALSIHLATSRRALQAGLRLPAR